MLDLHVILSTSQQVRIMLSLDLSGNAIGKLSDDVGVHDMQNIS
jgi:hypothetical protein